MGTQRTKAQIDTLFADNSSGAISPADLRDFVESAKPSRGALLFAASDTLCEVAGEFVKLANITTLDVSNRFSMPTDNRLQYDGAASVRAEVLAVLSGILVGSDSDLQAAIAKNGTVIEETIQWASVSSGQRAQLIIQADVAIATGDYLEIFVAVVDAEDVPENVSIANGRLTAIAHLT
jgi:hypothetical protein